MLLLFELVDSFRGDNETPELGEASCTSLAGLTGMLPCPGDCRVTEPWLNLLSQLRRARRLPARFCHTMGSTCETDGKLKPAPLHKTHI